MEPSELLGHVLSQVKSSLSAGKTTLMDVLAGRKTSGHVQGEIWVDGFEKEQATFARVSGYVEQVKINHTHIHHDGLC